MRLKISGGSLSMPPSRIVPPLKPSCQSLMVPFGGSRWASSVRRFAPGEDLERSDQHAPAGVPLDVDLGQVDRHRIIGRVGVDDVARADRDLAAEEGRHAVAAELALELAGQRQVGGVGEVLHPQRQQDVGGRDLVGADIDRAHAVLGGPIVARSDHGVRALLAEAERDAATARPAQAEADVLKGPFAAALLIVDDQVAVLQTDLVEVLAVEAGHAQTVEPVEALKNAARWPRLGSGLRCVAGLQARWRMAAAAHRCAGMSAAGPRPSWMRRRLRAAWRCRRRTP